jgi:hypothetical protein
MKPSFAAIILSTLPLIASPALAADEAKAAAAPAKDAAPADTGMRGNKPDIVRSHGRHAHGEGEHKGKHKREKTEEKQDSK